MSSRGSIARIVASAASALLLGLAWGAVIVVAPAFGAAPVVEEQEQWAVKVSATGATLEAKVNPGGMATTYRFEYATSEAALLAGEGMVFPAPPSAEGVAGAGSVGVVVEGHPQGLVPHTNYWYRVLATNGEGKALGCQAPGSCRSFTTQPASGGSGLPDGRMWELVSPAVKDGALISPLGLVGGLIQAGEAGGAITYLSSGLAGGGPGEQAAGQAVEAQLLSVRARNGGWFTQDIATPHEVATGIPTGYGYEYRWFSPDLALSVVEPLGSGDSGTSPEGAALLSEGASEKTTYLRDDKPLEPFASGAERLVYGDAEREALHPEVEGGYLPLVTGCALGGECRTQRVRELADVPPGTKFAGKNGPENIIFLSATPDLRHVVFYDRVPLVAKAGEDVIYEWSAGRSSTEPGRLRLVGVLPEGGQATRPVLGGNNGASAGEPANVRGAISSNGSYIIFTESSSHHLFMRDTVSEPESTAQLDVVEKGLVSPGNPSAEFQFASSDGSRVFFTDEQRLTAASKAESGKADLYECEMVATVAGGVECKLSDLTTEASAPMGAGVQSVNSFVSVGSDSSSYVYFVATGELTATGNARGETAKTGADNLYLLHYDEESKQWEAPIFIAVLSSQDEPDWSGFGSHLGAVTARVSPNGRYLSFMSEQNLTGYDNRDAHSGELDEEVYLYGAPSAGAPVGRLVCVSCNPTGERPVGVLDSAASREGQGLLVDQQNVWAQKNRWLAGSVPGWTAMALGLANYQSRYLSNDGRVFFNSPDSLVAQATNGLENVYEYEPVGVGGANGCTTSAVTFSERSGGCVSLASSGSSGAESVFLDASESGEDVFFLTSARLVGEDKDTAFDVYDAHVCGASAPCPSGSVIAGPCETADACRAAPVPQPSVFGAPSSATFSGPGNPVGSASTPVVKPRAKAAKCRKGLVRSHGRCVRKKKAKRARRAGGNRGVRS
jgi:hypothetical protein